MQMVRSNGINLHCRVEGPAGGQAVVFANSLGTDFRVNSYTINHQYYPSVAVDPRENFFVVWESNGQDGSARGVFGQRFGDFIFGDGFR